MDALDVPDAKRLKVLEDENPKLKKLLAEKCQAGCSRSRHYKSNAIVPATISELRKYQMARPAKLGLRRVVRFWEKGYTHYTSHASRHHPLGS